MSHQMGHLMRNYIQSHQLDTLMGGCRIPCCLRFHNKKPSILTFRLTQNQKCTFPIKMIGDTGCRVLLQVCARWTWTQALVFASGRSLARGPRRASLSQWDIIMIYCYYTCVCRFWGMCTPRICVTRILKVSVTQRRRQTRFSSGACTGALLGRAEYHLIFYVM